MSGSGWAAPRGGSRGHGPPLGMRGPVQLCGRVGVAVRTGIRIHAGEREAGPEVLNTLPGALGGGEPRPVPAGFHPGTLPLAT